MPRLSTQQKVLLVATVLVAALYWSGLSGPFLFDDFENFKPIAQWLQGDASFSEVVFGHQSLVFARPVAMASFLLNASVGGAEAFYFKLGNLLIHLGCGWLIWALCRRLLRLDARLQPLAETLSVLIAILWLVHPLHVSTVLYAVQRMTQLGTLFALASVLAYLAGRQRLATQRPVAYLLLFAAFPLLLLAGVLSKQHAAVAPALCLVIELAYHRRLVPGPKAPTAAFFSLFLGLPLLGLVALFAVRPGLLLAGYADYDFTLAERLLSEPRALVDYVGQILFPRTPRMGLYTDDFVVSRSLFEPISTVYSIAILGGVSVAAIALRRRAPTFFAGWFLFLAAHGVESTFLPLDIYFEHRNYLPMVGLLLSVIGLLGLLPAPLDTNVLTPKQLGMFTATAIVLVLSFATLGRVLVWSNQEAIIAQGLEHHPNSLRALLDKAALAQRAQRFDTYMEVMESLKASTIPRHRMLGNLYSLSIDCIRRQDSDPAYLSAAARNAGPRVTLAELLAFRVVAQEIQRRQGCGAITNTGVAQTIDQVLAATPTQSDAMQPKVLMRILAAELYMRDGKWPEAATQAALAWQPGADPSIGAQLGRIYMQQGRLDEASRTLEEVGARIKCHNASDRSNFEALWQSLQSLRTATGNAPAPSPIGCR